MATTIDVLRLTQDARYAATLTAEEWASVAQSPEFVQMAAEQSELLASISLADLMKQEPHVQELVGISSAS